MAKTRGATVSKPLPATTRSGRQALREKTNTSRSKVPVYEKDGNTDGLIKEARPPRGRPRNATPPDNDLVMAGGLGKAGATSSESTDEILPIGEAQPLDGKIEKKANRRPRGTRKIVPSETQQNMLAGMKQRMKDTARAQRLQKTTDASLELPVASNEPAAHDVAPANQSSQPSPVQQGRISVTRDTRLSMMMPPGSALKVLGTPAVENSILALRNFKRRPRQPSMLQMVQQRTNSARPSAVHATTSDGSSELDLDLSLDLDNSDGEDDFAPDAEGTPLRTNILKHESTRNLPDLDSSTIEVKSSANTRKRNSNEMSGSTATSRSSREKRQRSSVSNPQTSFVTALDRRVTTDQEASERIEMSQADAGTTIEVLRSPPPSSPPSYQSSARSELESPGSNIVIASSWPTRQQRSGGPTANLPYETEAEVEDGAMADPLSSSPLPEIRQELVLADYLADPVTQPSPDIRKTKARKTKEKTMSTTELQSLLPRRRRQVGPRQRTTTYDLGLDSQSDVGEWDEDEDDLLGRRATSSRANLTSGRSGKSGSKGGTKRPISSRGKKAKDAGAHAKSSRTYGRKSQSDKENDSAYESPFEDATESTVPDVSLTMHEAASSKELNEAKRKFAEIDDWDMEFESLSAEDHRSSSIGWR